MSTKYRNPASVAQDRVQQLSSQWNHSLSADGSNSNSSSGTSKTNNQKSKDEEWTEKSTLNSEDVNAKVWSQQIHGPGSNKNNLKPSTQQKSSAAGRGSDAETTHPSTMGASEGEMTGDNSNNESGDSTTSNGKPRGNTGRELPGKGLGNSGMGPERYAREEDDSLPAKDTGTPTKDNEKRSDE